MRTSRKALFGLASLTALIGGSSSVGSNDPGLFGTEGPSMAVTDAMVDAARSFRKIDANRDGIINEDEFAAQRVVYAQLARFNREIPIDAPETILLPVPDNVSATLGAPERHALDAVARRDFHSKALGSPGLNETAWQEARLQAFFEMDRDGNHVLSGSELDRYVRSMSGDLASVFPGS